MVSKKIEKILQRNNEIKALAKSLANAEKCWFLGRNADYGAALEGALKLKEISYIDCSGYPASELKHGTISLIDSNSVCIGLISNKDLLAKTVSNPALSNPTSKPPAPENRLIAVIFSTAETLLTILSHGIIGYPWM